MTIRAQTTVRDLPREREFLTRSSALSRTPGAFIDHGHDRLAEGESKFGDQWTRLTLEEFARELLEEAADLGAWAALAEQKLDSEIPVSHRATVRMLLIRVARHGAGAHEAVRQFEELLAKIRTDPEQPRAVDAA